MIYFLGVLFAGYFLGILWVVLGVSRLSNFQAMPFEKTTKFSIVIPFRNEAKHLPKLIQSLSELSYPSELFEIIWVNDASEDASEELVRSFINQSPLQQQLFQNAPYSEAPKKDALTLAVKAASQEWIVTTDADCQVPSYWLHFLDNCVQQEHPKMIAGPVMIDPITDFESSFQFWDFVSLQSVTWTGFGWRQPMLCNGAHLAFEKNVFFEVNGYEGNNSMATGDDVFLMQKIKQLYPRKIAYLKHPEAVVSTSPVASWKAIFQQRIRWASKTSKMQSTPLHLLGVSAAFGNVGVILCLFSIFIWPLKLPLFMGLLVTKLLIDILFLSVMGRFFRKQTNLLSLVGGVVLYPFVFLWILGQSKWGTYAWKSRTFKK